MSALEYLAAVATDLLTQPKLLRHTKQSWPPEGISWPPKKTISKATYSDLGPDLPPANIPPME